MPDQTITDKATIDIALTTLGTAIVGAIGAFAIFQPKFAIAASMKRENNGSLEPAFRILYVIPQYFSALIIGAFFLLLFAAFIHSIQPEVFANNKLLSDFGAFFVLHNLIWIVFLAAVVGASVRYNVLSWILLAASAVFPSGPFGRKGQSAGWLQTWNVCRASDNGLPLLLCQSEIERLADAILFQLTDPASGKADFAEMPANTNPGARANIALFGCILEATHYAQHWTSPRWAEFYGSLASINDRTGIFDPNELQRCRSGREFGERLRNELVAEVGSRSQPVPKDRYLAAADDLSSTWDVLHRHSGNVLRLIPFYAPIYGGRIYWLDRRLSQLPMMHSEGMRPQLIKLLARWQTLRSEAGVFVQPFSKRLGWLLLQETALRVLPAQKDVTFFDVGDVQLTRIACFRIFRSVERKVRARQSEEARNLDGLYPTQWDLFAAADFGLWSSGK